MFEKHILCSDCGKIYPLKTKIFRCRKCSGSLEIIFDYKKMKKAVNFEKLRKRPFNQERYREFYPVKKLVSIHEGGTPLIRSQNIEKKSGFELYFKYEAENPTGSFKDRGSSVEVAKALEFGSKHVICASTGNMGASVAAYSGVANLECKIFTTRDAELVKLEQILAYGAKVYRVHGNYDQAEKMVEEVARKYKVYLLGDYLYRREGTKSVGFEISEQIKDPDYIIIPIGNGTLLSAVWKAFKEFQTLGVIKKKSKLIGIQAEGCSPITRAFCKRSPIKPVRGETIATSIECGNPLDGKRVMESVKQSKGFLESVSDHQILKARELLARKEGLFSEPGGSASLAGFLKIKDRIERGSRVVCIVTGHGLKTPKTGVKGKPKDIPHDFGVLGKIFR